jgi:hypothetical protein
LNFSHIFNVSVFSADERGLDVGEVCPAPACRDRSHRREANSSKLFPEKNTSRSCFNCFLCKNEAGFQTTILPFNNFDSGFFGKINVQCETI